MPLVAVVALTLLSLIVVPPAEAAWRWPLRGEVRRPFAVTAARPYDAGQHRGVDLAARPGSVVRSACAGRVRFAGRIARSGVVSVRCGALVATYLELGAVHAVRGRRIGAGARLGAVGPAAHLHLGAREARSGRYVDPLILLRTPRGPTLGPAPDVAPPARAPRAPAPRVAPVPGPGPAGVPVVVWAGLALVAAGLPVGGLLVRQRSRQRTSWTSTSPASRPTRSAR
jgi:murein DD-endopeptidase MepM/ murein hydrolase activator NlpD